MAVNEDRLHELLGKFVTDLGGSFHAIAAVIGDRLGLYRALLEVMPAGAAQVAEQAGVDERYHSQQKHFADQRRPKISHQDPIQRSD